MVKNLKALRLKKGISQQVLAGSIGVSQQSINKYENHDVEPDIDTLVKLADYFGTSVDYLVGHTEISHIIESVSRYELNRQEAKLVDEYRRLLEKEKRCIEEVIGNFNQYKKGKRKKTP